MTGFKIAQTSCQCAIAVFAKPEFLDTLPSSPRPANIGKYNWKEAKHIRTTRFPFLAPGSTTCASVGTQLRTPIKRSVVSDFDGCRLEVSVLDPPTDDAELGSGGVTSSVSPLSPGSTSNLVTPSSSDAIPKWMEWSSCQRYLVFWDCLSRALCHRNGYSRLISDVTFDSETQLPTSMKIGPAKFELFVAQQVHF